MCAKLVIYASELKPLNSVISVIDGSDEFAFSTPFYPIPGVQPANKKAFLQPILDNNGGLFLKSPMIYARTPAKTYTPKFSIGWTAPKTPKEYRIIAPFGAGTLKQRQKLMVKPLGGTDAPEDYNLALLAWQLSMVQEVLLVARILELDLGKYKALTTNAKFYPAFVADANAVLQSKGCKKSLSVEKEYIESWNKCPILSKNERNEDIWIYDIAEPETEAFDTLFNSFYETVLSTKTKPNAKQFDLVWKYKTNAPSPSIRFKLFAKTPEEGQEPQPPTKMYDTRITFISVFEPKDPGFAKAPDWTITNQQLTKAKVAKLTKQGLISLWGGVWPPPSKDAHDSATYSGCIFLRLSSIYGFHEKGNPTVEFQADTIALNRTVKTSDDGIDDANDFMLDEQSSSSLEPSAQHEEDASNFVGDPNDMDPEALHI